MARLKEPETEPSGQAAQPSEGRREPAGLPHRHAKGPCRPLSGLPFPSGWPHPGPRSSLALTVPAEEEDLWPGLCCQPVPHSPPSLRVPRPGTAQESGCRRYSLGRGEVQGAHRRVPEIRGPRTRFTPPPHLAKRTVRHHRSLSPWTGAGSSHPATSLPLETASFQILSPGPHR